MASHLSQQAVVHGHHRLSTIPKAHYTKSHIIKQIKQQCSSLQLLPSCLPQQNYRQCCRHTHSISTNFPAECKASAQLGDQKIVKNNSNRKTLCQGLVPHPIHTNKTKQNTTTHNATTHTQQHPLHEFSPSLKPKYLFAKFKTFARFRILWRGTVFPTREFGRVVTQEEVTKPETFTKKQNLSLNPAKDLKLSTRSLEHEQSKAIM